VPGEVAFAGARVRAERGLGGRPSPHRVAVAVDGPLVVRPPRPGDRLALPSGGRQAVGRLLAAAGVPERLRAQVPVVATADRVVWVAGHRAASDLLAPEGRPGVVLELEPAGAVAP
jgi:tRNA(Ile)-lysidine synthetase-like protein